MARKSYALEHLDDVLYESEAHRWMASAIARGECPPEVEWNDRQRDAFRAYVDGGFQIHEYWTRKVTRLGHGHVEALVVRRTVDPWKTLFGRLFAYRKERGEDAEARMVERNAARAKQRVRQLAKALGVNSLGTLTYRENVTDRDTVLRHWKAFIRQVRRVLPEFAYVATIEPQKRGSLHVHFGMKRLPAKVLYTDPRTQRACLVKSWDCMRAIWRRVIAKDGLFGNFDESKKLGTGARARAMKIAGYIGKYVSKSFADGDLNRRRYFASEVPQFEVDVQKLHAGELADLMAGLFAEIPGELIDFTPYFQKNRKLFWFSAHVKAVPS